MKFVPNRRYIQIAFNHSIYEVRQILPQLPRDPRIIIEAGTPYIKREGTAGIQFIRRIWPGMIVADLKVTDGAAQEIFFSSAAGANAVTCMGSAPIETLDKFCTICKKRNIISMIDMLGVINPLKKLMPLKTRPDVVVIHKGRDEETSRSKIIRYKDISKIRSKFNVRISIAGGLTSEKVRSAYFNGGNIAVLNVVKPSDVNEGLPENINFQIVINKILKEVGE